MSNVHDSQRDGVDLSIVIVSWNTKELLRRCLDSVLAGGKPDATEIFVVDNASTDGSPELVADEYPSVRLIANSDNRGFAAANNQALSVCTGRHVLLLNPDTEVLGDVLQNCVAYLDSHPDVGVLGCRVLNDDRTMQPTCFQYPTLVNLFLQSSGLFRLEWPKFFGKERMRGWQRDSERDVDVVTGCYMMIPRPALEQVGLLDEAFFFCGEETDWCVRFRRHGWRVRFAPVGEIIHVGNASGRQLDYRRDLHLSNGLVRLHKKHGGRLSAAAAWSLLCCHSFSRWIYWATLGALIAPGRAKDRASNFRNLTLSFGKAWPAGRTSSGRSES